MSNEKMPEILMVGIGNSSRQDDGLGWQFLDFIRDSEISGLDLEYRYQLQIEDAELIAHYDRVIFVDATQETSEQGFIVKPCKSEHMDTLTSHALKPETILYLCQSVFDADPDCWILAIEGKQWELSQGLSPEARRNLCNAQKYFTEHLFDYL